MKLYTTSGDGGETCLFDGSRVPKDDPRVAAVGDLEELNSLLGWCRSVEGSGDMASKISEIQRELFTLGAELVMPADMAKASPNTTIQPEQIKRLETWIDEATEAVGPLCNFVLPGGSELACRLHITRTCCRRVERSVVTFGRSVELRSEALIYLNRLGDLLFEWSRVANREASLTNDLWVPKK